MKILSHLSAILFICIGLFFAACEGNQRGNFGFADQDMEEADTTNLPRGFEEPRENSVVRVMYPYSQTMAEAIQRTGLNDMLGTQERYTVFAPTDEAFNAIQANLENYSQDQLRELILRHVVPGEFTAEQLTNGQVLTSIAGSRIIVQVDEQTVRVSNAEVIEPDQGASNGVVHVINQVLSPDNGQ
jgi:uncharacterized surface protein with fasciclin (FAS1) repeats